MGINIDYIVMYSTPYVTTISSSSPSMANLIFHVLTLGQLMLIVEYCAGGNLLQYLRNKRHDVDSPLTVPLEMDMALQVSRGMSYLASQKVYICIHWPLYSSIVISVDPYHHLLIHWSVYLSILLSIIDLLVLHYLCH